MRKMALGLTGIVLGAQLLLAQNTAQNKAPSTLDMYFIDTEGGQATLIVTPAGETLLYDTGTGGDNNRDADRITEVIKKVAVEQQLDHVIVSHYHGDHVGNAAELSRRFPIRKFWDHGDWTLEGQPNRRAAFDTWHAVRPTARVEVPKPGAKIPLTGVDVTIVASAGEFISTPLAGMPGAGAANALCRDFTPRAQDATPENSVTLGAMIKYGAFRMLDLSDVIWNDERALVCPRNLLGTVDVYHTSRHGTDFAGSPAMVHAVRPRVAIMNNGARKGGTPGTYEIIRSSPGFEDLWQLHYSENVSREVNPPEQFIATMESAQGHKGYSFKLSARIDGSFTITNERNGFSKEYPAARSGGPSSR